MWWSSGHVLEVVAWSVTKYETTITEHALPTLTSLCAHVWCIWLLEILQDQGSHSTIAVKRVCCKTGKQNSQFNSARYDKAGHGKWDATHFQKCNYTHDSGVTLTQQRKHAAITLPAWHTGCKTPLSRVLVVELLAYCTVGTQHPAVHASGSGTLIW